MEIRQPVEFIRGILISRRPAETCARLPFGSALRIRARSSSLHLISGSHRLGYTIQELVKQHGLRRGDGSAQMIEAWAKEIDRSAHFVKPIMADGEAIIFDGRLWHGTENKRQDERTALLLQYAAADEKISLPDLSQLEWPFRFRSERPPTIVISGAALPGLNEVEKPPALSHSRRLHTSCMSRKTIIGG